MSLRGDRLLIGPVSRCDRHLYALLHPLGLLLSSYVLHRCATAPSIVVLISFLCFTLSSALPHLYTAVVFPSALLSHHLSASFIFFSIQCIASHRILQVYDKEAFFFFFLNYTKGVCSRLYADSCSRSNFFFSFFLLLLYYTFSLTLFLPALPLWLCVDFWPFSFFSLSSFCLRL